MYMLDLYSQLVDKEMTDMQVVCEDGVHLTDRYCRNIAVNLCYRVAESEALLLREASKRRRV